MEIREDDGCALTAAGGVSCWQVKFEGDDYVLESGPFVVLAEGAVELIGGEFGYCVRTRGGAVLCGVPTPEHAELQVEIEGKAVEIAAGRGHYCARIDEDGDGTSERVECHGENELGQLGKLGTHVMLQPTKIELQR
ncbi:MAG: hypothetical protein KC431_30280 [Myxococcales bacterium]|nr:hypothetical protein [Myxococcales bacterium]